MKANELQIGDLVFVGGIPRKVCSITKKKIGYHREEYASRLFYARMYEVFPIHLTAEILEKNGFDSKTFLSDEWDKIIINELHEVREGGIIHNEAQLFIGIKEED